MIKRTLPVWPLNKAVVLTVIVLLVCFAARAQDVERVLASGMKWRLIGPYRGGRVTAVAGIPGDPSTYFIGTPAGGVWKTTDGGIVWQPVSDDVHVASIGAVAVAASHPDTIYMGTGEWFPGNGAYKSNNGGKTWEHIGLENTWAIPVIIVSPKDHNLVLAAATGTALHASADRGVFRSTDGGKTWHKVLFRDDRTGAIDLCFDPDNARIVFAALWRSRVPATFFGQNKEEKPKTPDAAIYRSIDGGLTWKQIAGRGLPSGDWGRVGLAVAPRLLRAGRRRKTADIAAFEHERVFAILTKGLFRSDDSGKTWKQITEDPRITGNMYFSRVFVDPSNRDTIFVAQTSLYRSTDGGQHFEAYKGAPGGDDNHVVWIDPENDHRMILGSDQGATVSLDGGATWSSWFNLPNGQFYRVSTDQQFPYRVYASQQDSGTAAVLSRSDFGRITERDWAPVGGFEYGHVIPDPRHPNWVYTQGWYQTLVRFDRVTGQIFTVFVNPGKYRLNSIVPFAFDPRDPHVLYMAAERLLRSDDDANSWGPISPDLTIKPGEDPEKAKGRITAFAPSSVSSGVIWTGTSNGMVQVTTNGGTTWKDVTPSALAEGSNIKIVEASHFDAGTAFVVAAAHDDFHPRIYRTSDFGQQWQEIVQGLADDVPANVVREDQETRGLLYAGTDRGVYVSMDSGGLWQPLQLNLPTTIISDLAVHDDDLIACTFGRALWILGDITPLRQFQQYIPAKEAALLHPITAWRVRWDENQDTPLPPEIPAGENPPEGALIDYYLPEVPHGEVQLSIFDDSGKLVRTFSSVEQKSSRASLPVNVPDYWFGPETVLPEHAGLNRFAWDLRYPGPSLLPYGYYGEVLHYREMTLTVNAVKGKTPLEPRGPLVLPGNYKVELIVDGRTASEPLTVQQDPRVPVSRSDLERQLRMALILNRNLDLTYEVVQGLAGISTRLAQLHEAAVPAAAHPALAGGQAASDGSSDTKSAGKDFLISSAADLDKELKAILERQGSEPGISVIHREMSRLAETVQTGDAAPTQAFTIAFKTWCDHLDAAFGRLNDFLGVKLPAFNKALGQSAVAPLVAPDLPHASACGPM